MLEVFQHVALAFDLVFEGGLQRLALGDGAVDAFAHGKRFDKAVEVGRVAADDVDVGLAQRRAQHLGLLFGNAGLRFDGAHGLGRRRGIRAPGLQRPCPGAPGLSYARRQPEDQSVVGGRGLQGLHSDRRYVDYHRTGNPPEKH